MKQAFAMALRAQRRRAGFSQEKLALEGLNRGHLSELERGLHDPRLSMLFRLADLLNMDFMTLCREIDRHYLRLTERETRKTKH